MTDILNHDHFLLFEQLYFVLNKRKLSFNYKVLLFFNWGGQ